MTVKKMKMQQFIILDHAKPFLSQKTGLELKAFGCTSISNKRAVTMLNVEFNVSPALMERTAYRSDWREQTAEIAERTCKTLGISI